MNYEMKLTEDPFNRIKNGVKKVEVRLYDDKRKKIRIGDTITFYKLPNLKESVKIKVIGLSRFNDFHTLFSILGTNLFGNNRSVEQQVLAMREVYSEEMESKYGVLGIHIKL